MVENTLSSSLLTTGCCCHVFSCSSSLNKKKKIGMEMNDEQSLQHVALNNFTKSINDKNINVFISLCFGHSRLIMAVHESSGFPWFRGRCQSFGGPCLSFHNGVNFVCSATLFLSLVCKASCNTDTIHINH